MLSRHGCAPLLPAAGAADQRLDNAIKLLIPYEHNHDSPATLTSAQARCRHCCRNEVSSNSRFSSVRHWRRRQLPGTHSRETGIVQALLNRAWGAVAHAHHRMRYTAVSNWPNPRFSTIHSEAVGGHVAAGSHG